MRGIYICINCLDTNATKIGNNIVCTKCGHPEKISNYKSLLTEIKFIVRFGYQYRLKYEEDLMKDPNLSGRYNLYELHKIFEFLGLAVITGMAGNFAYDSIKNIIKTIVQNPIIIKIKDEQFQNLLHDEKEMETFIRYIEEYRNKKINTDKVINAIYEEEETHGKVQRFLASPQFKEILKKFDKKNKLTRSKKKKK